MVEYCAGRIPSRLGSMRENQSDAGIRSWSDLVGRWGVYVRPCVGIFERDLIGATTGMARASCVICSGVSTRGRLGNKPWRKSRHRWMEWTGPEGLVLSVVWGEVQ